MIGLAVNGTGATLTAPTAPTTAIYSSDCEELVDPGFFGSCRVITAPSGTMAAIVEQQRGASAGASGGPAPIQERDLVYHRVGDRWSLALRREFTSTSGDETDLWQSDVNRDGDPKAVFVTPATNATYGQELDVVEANGTVTLFRELKGGFATIAAGGGLETFVPDTTGYTATVIRYTAGAWRVASVTAMSATQAVPDSEGPFDDPQGISVT